MRIHCFTNLDLLPCEKWPEDLPVVPCVGDRIESGHKWKIDGEGPAHAVELRVVMITWRLFPVTLGGPKSEWAPRVELHLPTYWENLTAFFTWYGKITGRGKSAFI